MFRRCPKTFHNNCNCINHIGVIYSQYPFGDTFSKRNPGHIETNQQICNANLLTGFYVTRVCTTGASAQALVKELVEKALGKCLNILNTEHFWKLDRDPTKPIEAKIRRAVRKITCQAKNIWEFIQLAQHLENFMGWPRDTKYPLMERLIIFHYVQLYPT